MVGRGRAYRERLFYAAMGCAMLVTVFVGFAPSFYLRSGGGLPLLLTVHGVVFSSWLVLFIVQTALIAGRRTDVHRRVGVAGALLALTMLVLGTLVALRSVSGEPPNPAAVTFLATPLFDMVVFAVLCGSALALRGVPQTHKRLMLIATIGLLSPATGRMHWPAGWLGIVSDFVIPDLFLVPLLAWDLFTRRRPHRATVFGAVVLIGSQFLRTALSHTDAWQRFGAWAAGLVRG